MRASEYPNQLQITYRRLLISMAALEKAVQQTQSQERVLNSHVACELNGRHLAHSSHSKALISPDAQANSPLIHPPPETPPAPPSPVKSAVLCRALGSGRAGLAVYLCTELSYFVACWPSPQPSPRGRGSKKIMLDL